MPSYSPNRQSRRQRLQTMVGSTGVTRTPPTASDAVVPRKPNPLDPGFYRDKPATGRSLQAEYRAGTPANLGPGPRGSITVPGSKFGKTDNPQTPSQNLKNILTFNELHQGGKEIGAYNATHAHGKAIDPGLIQKLKDLKQRRKKVSATSTAPGYTPS